MTGINALLKAHGVDTTSVTAWTYGYFPFTMGSNVWHAMGCRVKCTEPEDFGKGFFCQVIKSPDGKHIAVVESTTGAIVGETEDDVRRDIAMGDVGVMLEQVARAGRDKGDMTMVSEEEFWRRICGARSK